MNRILYRLSLKRVVQRGNSLHRPSSHLDNTSAIPTTNWKSHIQYGGPNNRMHCATLLLSRCLFIPLHHLCDLPPSNCLCSGYAKLLTVCLLTETVFISTKGISYFW